MGGSKVKEVNRYKAGGSRDQVCLGNIAVGLSSRCPGLSYTPAGRWESVQSSDVCVPQFPLYSGNRGIQTGEHVSHCVYLITDAAELSK